MVSKKELKDRIRELSETVRKLELERAALVIVEVPVPRASLHAPSISKFRRSAILLQFQASSRSAESALLWYSGWKLAQIVYLHSTSSFWAGMKSFLIAPDCLRSQQGPDPEDSVAVGKYESQMRKEIKNG